MQAYVEAPHVENLLSRKPRSPGAPHQKAHGRRQGFGATPRGRFEITQHQSRGHNNVSLSRHNSVPQMVRAQSPPTGFSTPLGFNRLRPGPDGTFAPPPRFGTPAMDSNVPKVVTLQCVRKSDGTIRPATYAEMQQSLSTPAFVSHPYSASTAGTATNNIKCASNSAHAAGITDDVQRSNAMVVSPVKYNATMNSSLAQLEDKPLVESATATAGNLKDREVRKLSAYSPKSATTAGAEILTNRDSAFVSTTSVKAVYNSDRELRAAHRHETGPLATILSGHHTTAKADMLSPEGNHKASTVSTIRPFDAQAVVNRNASGGSKGDHEAFSSFSTFGPGKQTSNMSAAPSSRTLSERIEHLRPKSGSIPRPAQGWTEMSVASVGGPATCPPDRSITTAMGTVQPTPASRLEQSSTANAMLQADRASQALRRPPFRYVRPHLEVLGKMARYSPNDMQRFKLSLIHI